MKKCSVLSFLAVSVLIASTTFAEDVAGREIAPWQPGMLDIHQISTGRGNAGLYILPDGTTLLVDAGELSSKSPRNTPDRPDSTRTAGEWISRYIKHALRHDPHPALDYVLLTHFHGDHIGSIAANSPDSPSGQYKLTGLTRVAEDFPIGKLLDRDWPDYKSQVPNDSTTKNYLAFIKWQTQNNRLKAERFIPGRNNQILLHRDPKKYPNFEFRNIGSNGEVWTGADDKTRQLFPDLKSVPRADWPSENMLSISFRLRYGRFDYFNGADTPGVPPEGAPLWHDVETPVASVVGPVDAAILDHHGYLDSQNEFLVSTLRPRVWTISVWVAAHPTDRVWNRLRSTRLYPGPRDIFATDLHPATQLVISSLDKLSSSHGHIVLRVSPGGDNYRVVIVDDTSESHNVTKVFGPYSSN